MATKECPKCESRNGLNMMKGEVTQLMDATTKTPQIIVWTCGFCGHTDSDTIHMGSMGGNQNEKSIVGTIVPGAPFQATRPEAPLSSVRPIKQEPTVTPTVDIVD